MRFCPAMPPRFLVAALLLGSSSVLPAVAAELKNLLAYEPVPSADVKLVGEKRVDGVLVQDVTFASVGENKPVEAYIVRPEQTAPLLAGVLFVHWFDPSQPTSNRTQFLDEAKALARRGTVSLLVSTFWSDPKRYDARTWQTDFENSLKQTRDLRRALDVLLAQPNVDPQRIAYVGHDYGAMFGHVVAAVEARPKAWVFIAGTARFPDWYLFGSSTGKPTGDDLKKFRDEFAQIDPVNVIGRASGKIFYQYGEADFYTPRADFIALYLAAPEKMKRIATYPSGHGMEAEIIHHDRLAWLAEQLGLR
jgi:dienelactone hydrolase